MNGIEIEGAGDTVLEKLDRFDRRVYGEIRDAADAVRSLEKAAAERGLPAGGWLLRDLWGALYKADPRLRAKVSPRLLLNRKLLAQAQELPEFADLRQVTRLDEWSAALGMAAIGPKVLDAIPEQAAERMRQAAEAESRARSLLDQAAGYTSAADEAAEGGQDDLAQSLREGAKRAAAEGEETLAQAQTAADAALSCVNWKQVRAEVKKAASEARQVSDETDAFLAGWGTAPGQLRAVDPRAKFDLARRLLQGSPVLREIARLAGRLIPLALQKQREKVHQEPPDVVDVRLGSDLADVLPSELSLFAHRAARRDFLRRFGESQLLQRERTDRRPRGRGPIVLCLDTSSSMSGSKHVWCKAVALALIRVALREKRVFSCIVFGSRTECSRFDFPDGASVTADSLLEMAGRFYDGGTDFETPLEEALRVLEASAFKKADIVFVTDGECLLTEGFLREFLARKKAREFAVYGVAVPGGTTRTLEPFCDRVFFAVPGESDGEALDAIFSV